VVSPEVKAIEARLWAEASPHQRVAAIMVGQATGQEDLPHILAELRTVLIKDALEARLVGMAFALTHVAADNLHGARMMQPYPDGPATGPGSRRCGSPRRPASASRRLLDIGVAARRSTGSR
jgi:hypothetical protein